MHAKYKIHEKWDIIEFIRNLTLACLFWSIFLHCFNSCSLGIIYGPMSSHGSFWGLHRDGIIMMSCSTFDGVYMTSVLSIIFLYLKKNDGGPDRNCGLARVIHVPSTLLRKL